MSVRETMERLAAAREERPAFLRASLLPAHVAHFFARAENRGGGGVPLSRIWKRNELRRATMVEVLEFTWGRELGRAGGCATHSYLAIPWSWTKSKNNEWPFAVAIR